MATFTIKSGGVDPQTIDRVICSAREAERRLSRSNGRTDIRDGAQATMETTNGKRQWFRDGGRWIKVG